MSDEWAKSLLNQMGYVKRKACSKAKVDVEHFEKLKKEFLTNIRNIVVMDKIPPDLMINFDQTGINYLPISSWTMEKEGAKRVEMVAKDDKRLMTAVFAGPFQVISYRLNLYMKERRHGIFHAFNFLLPHLYGKPLVK